MKKLYKRIFVLVFILAVCDYVIGGICLDYLNRHAKGGSTKNNHYIFSECMADVIVLGSSRATHHYIPKILSDSLNLSCYNCGEEGNGIILAYSRYKMLTERYIPKIVLYEITPGYDYFLDRDYTKYLKYIKPYYGNKNVKEVIDLFLPWYKRVQLRSRLYRNNSSCLTSVVDNLIARDNNDGYSPLFGEVEDGTTFDVGSGVHQTDSTKLHLLRLLAEDCMKKGIKLFFVVSPMYIPLAPVSYDEAKTVSIEAGVPFISYETSVDFRGRNDLFQDNSHLNNKGASLFSELLAHDLKSLITEK